MSLVKHGLAMNNSRNVRLNEEYIRVIKSLAKKYFNSEEVIIFGSRTDLKKRGGDIDIYIHTQKKDNLLQSKLAFLRDFELILGEQKVDLIVQSGGEEKKIHKIARSQGVRI